MIIDYDHNPNITFDQKIQSLKESVQMALNDMETRMQSISASDEEIKVFVASINGTSFATVEKALREGKLVFAATPNSYGTYNIYPYAHQNATSIVFTRNQYSVYGGNVTPQFKFVLLKNDDTWETITSTISDYVVEQGTIDIWTYRKWNSGIAECWGLSTYKTAISTTVGSSYRSSSAKAETLPFTFADANYVVTGQPQSGLMHSLYIAGKQTTTFTWYAVHYTSSSTSSDRLACFHILGRWK